LWFQVGSAPTSIRISRISKMVPIDMIVLPFPCCG